MITNSVPRHATGRIDLARHVDAEPGSRMPFQSLRLRVCAMTGSARTSALRTGAVGLAVMLLGLTAGVGFSAEPEALFEVTTIAEGFSQPIAMQQAADGRLFLCERGGTIHTIDTATGASSPWAGIEVITDSECGLLGLALHPDFPAEPFVYVFATVSHTEQQIIRLRDEAGIGTDPVVIQDHIPTRGVNHNAGCVRIGPDRRIYFTVGDTGIPANGQSMATLAGKLCRIELDGSIPGDNPFSTPTGAPSAIFALGLRNPFRFCIGPDGRVFVMDVGSEEAHRREEINLVAAGDNLGWPAHEGAHPDAPAEGYVNPIYEYHEKGSSIAGCVVYGGRQFPASYRGNLFHVDYTSHGLFRVEFDGNQVANHSLFIQATGGPVDVTELMDGSLVFCELFTGSVKRVSYIGPPEEVAGAAPDDQQAAGDDPDPSTTASPLCGQGAMPLLMLAGAAALVRRRHSGSAL